MATACSDNINRYSCSMISPENRVHDARYNYILFNRPMIKERHEIVDAD